MIRSVRSPSKDDLGSMSGSITSNVTSLSIQNTYHIDLMASQRSELMESSERISTRNRKKKYVREAVIADDDDQETETNMSSSIASLPMETSAEHLETKKQILALRAKFGDEKWLVSDAGSFVQDIMGLERSTIPTIDLSSGLGPTFSPVVTTVVGNSSTDFSTDSAVWSNESSSDDAIAESTIRKLDKVEGDENARTISESDHSESIIIEDRVESPKSIEPPYDPGEGKNCTFCFNPP